MRFERMTEIDPLTGEVLGQRQRLDIYPAKHWVTTQERLNASIELIEKELQERLEELEGRGETAGSGSFEAAYQF